MEHFSGVIKKRLHDLASVGIPLRHLHVFETNSWHRELGDRHLSEVTLDRRKGRSAQGIPIRARSCMALFAGAASVRVVIFRGNRTANVTKIAAKTSQSQQNRASAIF